MFGLTKREQRWKAEQQAAEMLAALAGTALRAAADVRIAEAQTDADELARLRKLYDELLMAVGKKYPGETRHETALRYIRQAEMVVVGPARCDGPNLNSTTQDVA